MADASCPSYGVAVPKRQRVKKGELSSTQRKVISAVALAAGTSRATCQLAIRREDITIACVAYGWLL